MTFTKQDFDRAMAKYSEEMERMLLFGEPIVGGLSVPCPRPFPARVGLKIKSIWWGIGQVCFNAGVKVFGWEQEREW